MKNQIKVYSSRKPCRWFLRSNIRLTLIVASRTRNLVSHRRKSSWCTLESSSAVRASLYINLRQKWWASFREFSHIFISYLWRRGFAKVIVPRKSKSEHKQDFQYRLFFPVRFLNNNNLTEMCIDGSVTSSSCKIFVIFVRNVYSFPSLILLGQPKINHEDNVGLFLSSNQEIIRFDIPMQEPLSMYVLDSVKYLQTDEYDSFQRKGFAILFEFWFQRVSQLFHYHDVLFALCKILINLMHRSNVYFENSSFVGFSVPIKHLQDFGLVVKLWIFSIWFLYFKSDHFVLSIDSRINLSEGSWPNLVADNFILSKGFHI